MTQFQMAIAAMAFCDINGAPRDAEGRRRQYTAAELDALAEFRWPLAGVMERLVIGANAITSRLRPRERLSIEPTVSPLGEAPATT
jgi:hypothetical protein